MSVKTASRLVSRMFRAAMKETISPANQGVRESLTLRPFSEASKVSRQFGHQLQQRVDAYTGSVDEFGSPGNTVDNWRLQFSGRASDFKAANGVVIGKKRQA